ncbi:hypothetical protein WJX82_007972 [Trebouxia sp. C0006]
MPLADVSGSEPSGPSSELSRSSVGLGDLSGVPHSGILPRQVLRTVSWRASFCQGGHQQPLAFPHGFLQYPVKMWCPIEGWGDVYPKISVGLSVGVQERDSHLNRGWMKIKKRSGDKEHCLRLLPCLRRRPSHPHQDEQLVNYLVHPFWKMLEQFIWYAVGTRSSSGTGVFNLGSLGSGGGSRPGFRNFMQDCLYILVPFFVKSNVFLGWWLLESCRASHTDCISRLDSGLPMVPWIRVVATFSDCVCLLPVARVPGLSGSLSQRDLRSSLTVYKHVTWRIATGDQAETQLRRISAAMSCSIFSYLTSLVQLKQHQLDQAIPGQELDQWPHCDFAGEFITGSSIGQWEPW